MKIKAHLRFSTNLIKSDLREWHYIKAIHFQAKVQTGTASDHTVSCSLG